MSKQKGQIVLGTISIISLIGSVILGTGFFWNSQNTQDKRADQIEREVSEFNGKIDALLDHFEIKYEPKYIDNQT